MEVIEFINRRWKKDANWLDGKFYDFSGELVAPGGAYCVPWDEMEEYDALLYKRIIRDCVM